LAWFYEIELHTCFLSCKDRLPKTDSCNVYAFANWFFLIEHSSKTQDIFFSWGKSWVLILPSGVGEGIFQTKIPRHTKRHITQWHDFAAYRGH